LSFTSTVRSWRQGLLRNAPAEFQNMSLSEDDVAALVAFLTSLAEDYEDA